MRKILLLILNLMFLQQAFSQWNNNSTVNNLVATNAGEEQQAYPIVVNDGFNGSIIIYMGSNFYIYAQKITSTGIIAWGGISNPVKICNGTAAYDNTTKAIWDGAGGAYITWEDSRDGNDEIYMQHINSNGIALWPINGIRVTNSINVYDNRPYLCNDGTGGVIVSWTAFSNSNTQVYAQRYNSNGGPQWVSNGMQVCIATGFRFGANVVADGNSGAIFFFLDTRNDPNATNDFDNLTNADLYAQRLDGDGVRIWTDDGAAICTAPGNQSNYAYSISDGNGGAIWVFDDERNGNSDVYTQKLNSNGISQWGNNGVPVTIALGSQSPRSIVNDGLGGAVVAWRASTNLMTQRINSSGSPVWNTNGILVSSNGSDEVQIVTDSLNNYIYSFNGPGSSSQRWLFVQKINSAGITQWNPNGITVSNNSVRNTRPNPSAVLSDNGSLIIGWVSNVNLYTPTNLYASKVLSTGVLAGSLSSSFVSTVNGNWNDPATWAGGVIPSATAQVNIRHVVTVTANATCKFLIVEQPAGNVRVKTGVTFAVTN